MAQKAKEKRKATEGRPSKKLPPNLAEVSTRAEVAKAANISERTIDSVKGILETGTLPTGNDPRHGSTIFVVC